MKIGKWNVGILAIDTTDPDRSDIALHTQNFLFELDLMCSFSSNYFRDKNKPHAAEFYNELHHDIHEFLRECGYFGNEEEEK